MSDKVTKNTAIDSKPHHYIEGNISVFSRGLFCFCYFNPNFLHGDLHSYCGEYWGGSRMSALKKWGVKTQLLFFLPFLVVGKSTMLSQKLCSNSR